MPKQSRSAKQMNPMNGGTEHKKLDSSLKANSQGRLNNGKKSKEARYVTSNRTTDHGLEYSKDMSSDGRNALHQSGKSAPPPTSQSRSHVTKPRLTNTRGPQTGSPHLGSTIWDFRSSKRSYGSSTAAAAETRGRACSRHPVRSTTPVVASRQHRGN